MNIYLITLEELETRYTSQWKRWINNDLTKAGMNCVNIDGDTKTNVYGQNFLNPTSTNIFKSEQIIKLSKLFQNKQVTEGDIFLFYDAWHYGIIPLRYMSILNNIPIKIYGLWHAGSYDPYDLLGQKDKDKVFLSFEESLIKNLDKSFVATKFHKDMMIKNLKVPEEKIKITGFPYCFEELDRYKIPYSEKENIVVFPHRLSKEKNPDLLRLIELYIDGKVIFCQEKSLPKKEYHKILAKSKVVFSASNQETWGLGVFEAMYLGCIPVIPNRLSYKECYFNDFRYEKREETVFNLATIIDDRFKNYKNYEYYMKNNINYLKNYYCTTKNIINEIKKEIKK